jgi:signal transduction histidine kinase/CheY-like chemotaxis protein
MAQRWWLEWRDLLTGGLFNRRQLLMVCLFITAVSSMMFYFVPQTAYDHRVNVWFSLFLFSIMPLAVFARLYHLISHVFLMAIVLGMSTIAFQTGGINSSVLVWLVVMSIAALLLLGPAGTGLWLGVSLGAQALLWVGAHQGWLGSTITHDHETLPWAFFNHAGAMACLMMALWLFDLLHRRRLLEVERRNQALLDIHAELLQAQAHKDEFVASVGHELRTPMNAILGLNGVLRDEFKNQPQAMQTVDLIRGSTESLLALINDILDFSQLKSGRVVFHPEPCDLLSWMNTYAEPHVKRVHAKGLTLGWNVPDVRVQVDIGRLAQIVNHLLDNAIKFTASGRIDITCLVQGDRLWFEVQDTGRGIPMSRQLQIFNRFEHADEQTNRVYGGTGLGLAICERLVVLQQGRLGVSSEEGVGSRFWFELPCQVVDTHAIAQPTVEQGLMPSEFDVLLVDDNVVNLMVAQLQIKKHFSGARITAVESGHAALQALEQRTFHIALIDMVMPDMNGMELTRRLRTSAEHALMPILALTANTNPMDRQRCLDSGMNGVLHKPMDSQMVHKTLTHWLSQPPFWSKK